MSDCNPKDCSPPGSSVHGISQARILEWVAISFPRGIFLDQDWTRVSSISGQICYRWARGEAQATKESQHSVICVWDRTFVSDHSSQLSFVDVWRCICYGLEYPLGWVTEEQWEEREPRRISISPFLYQSGGREEVVSQACGCAPGDFLAHDFPQPLCADFLLCVFVHHL